MRGIDRKATCQSILWPLVNIFNQENFSLPVYFNICINKGSSAYYKTKKQLQQSMKWYLIVSLAPKSIKAQQSRLNKQELNSQRENNNTWQTELGKKQGSKSCTYKIKPQVIPNRWRWPRVSCDKKKNHKNSADN